MQKRHIAVVLGALLIGGLFAGIVIAEDELKKIAAGKTQSLPKPAKHWKGKGRLVGAAKNAPHFKAQACTPCGKKVIKTAMSEKGGSYEVEKLKPGKYLLRISAKGYETLEIKDLEVKANHDVRIDLEF